VTSGLVGADNNVEVFGQSHVTEGPVGQKVGPAGDDAEGVTVRVQPGDELGNPVEGAGEPVVMLELVRAIALYERLEVVVSGILPELPDEWTPDGGDPFLHRRTRTGARVEGVLHCADQEFERVDERPV